MSRRLFTAFRVSANKEIRDLINFLKEFKSTKTVEEENLHVNLKFLGEVRENKVKDALNALKEAEGFGEFEETLSGTGAFPNKDYIKILWIGLKSKKLLELNSLLEKAFTEKNFKEDKRKFKPHLTVARVKSKPNEGIKKVFGERFDKHYKDIKVKHVELIESKLTSKGPVYETIEKVKL